MSADHDGHRAMFGEELGRPVVALERVQLSHGQAIDGASGAIGPSVGLCLTDSDDVEHAVAMDAGQARTLAGGLLDSARLAEAEAGIAVADECPACVLLRAKAGQLAGLLERLSPARVMLALELAATGADREAILSRLAHGADL